MCEQKNKHKKHQVSKLLPVASVLTLSAMAIAATPLFASANASVSGQVEVAVDVEPAIAMTITGNNDDGSKHSEPGRSYNSVDNFSPEEIAGSNVDGHSIPATAVTGVSSSYATILPNAVINGSSENGFRSTVTVYTNNAVGYFLTVRDSDNNTNLTHASGTDYIPTTDSALSAGTAGWNFDVTKFGTRTGDIWAPTADGNDSITVENNAITPTDATIDSLSTKTSNGRTTYVDYNVATSEDQTAGIYSDTLVYTATADPATSSFMTISPSTINTGSAANITATTPLYTTDGHASTTFYLLTEAQYAEVKSGTDVSQVGGTILSTTRTSSTPVTYSVDIPSISTPGNYYVYADIADFTEDFEAKIVVDESPAHGLTVNPNGGTWSGSTSSQTFTQDNGTTKSIADPSANATYSISYEANGQGATYTGTPTSVARSFTGWDKAGSGEWDSNSKIYTFGEGDGSLTAQYNSTSDSFALPSISKTGHNCYWASDATGTKFGDGGESKTISSNTVLYAYCTANQHTVTANKGTGISSVSGDGSKDYNSTVTLSATPSTGYHHTGWTVNSGGVTINNNQFTMPDNDVTVTANAALNTCPIKYNSNAPSGTTATGSMSNSSMTYGSNTTLTSNAFAVTGYSFQGWAESATGAKVFDNGGTISGTTYCTSHNTTKNLYAVWAKKYTYTLNLNANDGTASSQPVSAGPTTATSYTFSNLNNYAPTRDGYKFLGWATTSTGTSYVTSYTLNSSSASATATSDGFPVSGTLYAKWEKIMYIQDQTYINQCKNAAVGTTLTLTDSRDGNEYKVRKLADGKCWMVENLRLNGPRTLTSSDSNVSSNFTLSASNSGTWCTTSSSACNNQSMTLDTGNSSYGTYYNWYAATAGTGTYEMTSGDASSSICPRGWRLPTGGYYSGEFQDLYNQYPSLANMLDTNGPAFVQSGKHRGGSTDNQGSEGLYWSSTARFEYYAYDLYLDSSNANLGDVSGKYSGFAVRCVAQ